MHVDDLKKTWDDFLASKERGKPDEVLKNRLIEHYYPLVKKTAIRVHQKITHVDVDELTSEGVKGLYDAVDNYDRSKLTKFETYAPTRIEGSMRDAIRSNDWIPRLVRSKANFLDRERSRIETRLGHHASNAEMARELEMSEADFEELHQAAATPAVHNIAEVHNNDGGDTGFSIEHLEDSDAAQPVDAMVREELWKKLLGTNFTPQEQQIIKLYYREDLSMKEISEIVDLSESRVSQMHTVTLKRLSQKAKRNPKYFADILRVVERFKEAQTA
jgi:RNA polymerase sigma factor for flagellar operon FliA